MSREDSVSERLPAAAKDEPHNNSNRNLNPHLPPPRMSNEWKDFRYFAGFDWASRSHQVVIVDAQGRVTADFIFENTAAGWALWREKIKEFAPLAVCVETRQGALVERLLETEGCAVYPIHPKAGKAYCAQGAQRRED